ncbi:TIM barrel protein [Umezawaea sp. NPDC059074]|uniref:TIM barrel protein n=1 Tax=Umezawaea sp. NPDC059074 TaxID=3346716 RepID=UPI00368DA74A
MRAYSANLSLLFGDLPLLDRPAAAAAAGFEHVESWWPFDGPTPPDDGFARALVAAGVRLVSLNLDAGGSNGLLVDPAAGARFRENLNAVGELLELTGCRIVNALYGNGKRSALADERLALVVESLDATVVLETLNVHDTPAYALTDVHETARVVEDVGKRCGTGDLGLLVDVYHLAMMGEDPAAVLRRYAPLVRHVQFADVPGRGGPGTGTLDFALLERTLDEIGYQGFIGLEHRKGVPS